MKQATVFPSKDGFTLYLRNGQSREFGTLSEVRHYCEQNGFVAEFPEK